jgi:acyl-CoA-dependent ceramide synthase
MPYGCYNSKTAALVSSDGGSHIFANVLQPFNDPSGTVCFNARIRWYFLALLLALQVITIIWFGMIIRVAYGVISGKAAQDSRSDDEEEDMSAAESDTEFSFETTTTTTTTTTMDNEKTSISTPQLEAGASSSSSSSADPIEVEVDADDITGAFNGRPGSPSSARTRSQMRSAAARATAISIPGHSDRKELLGRIGCDKPT